MVVLRRSVRPAGLTTKVNTPRIRRICIAGKTTWKNSPLRSRDVVMYLREDEREGRGCK